MSQQKQAIKLIKTLYNESCLVFIQRTIKVCFTLNPFATNGCPVRRKNNKSPSVINLKGSKFSFHGIKLVGVF